MQKQAIFKVKGMQRDLALSAFNSEFAYEIKNMRLVTSENNSLLSLTNEKGTKKLSILNQLKGIEGTPIGEAVIDDDLILFTTSKTPYTDGKKDIIYRLWYTGSILNGTELYRGNLNFNTDNPIETVTLYENNELKKIYWTDGLNQPRLINIKSSKEYINKWNDNSFDFVNLLKLKEEVDISKNSTSSGIFPSGVIQYAFTYYNKYLQETNIFYTSPLYYISYFNRGGSPEDTISNSFNISIKNPDTNFDYVRIYSIIRTSINAIPSAKRVIDLAIPNNGSSITYLDNGENGDSIDPSDLLYIGGEEIVAGTMSQKDNVLFLGNITVKRKVLDEEIRNFFKEKDITFTIGNLKSLQYVEPKSYYPYENQLKDNSQKIKTFKYLEWYRFGIQFQHYTGKWSEPIWIKDLRNEVHINSSFYKNDDLKLPYATFTFKNDNTTSIVDKLIAQGYVKARPVVVYPTINDRECICQGILCPTVYNVGDRYDNSPFAQSSWFVRPNSPFDIKKLEKTSEWNDFKKDEYLEPSKYSRSGIVTNSSTRVKYKTTYNTDKYMDIDLTKYGSWAEFRHNYPIPANTSRNAEIQCLTNTEPPYINKQYEIEEDTGQTDDDGEPIYKYTTIDTDDNRINSWVSQHDENYYIDQSIVTLHSPDIEFDDNVKNLDMSNLKLRITGIVPITSFYGDIDITTSTPVNNFKDSSDLPPGFYKESIGVENDFSSDETHTTYYGESHFGWRSLLSGPFWFDEITGLKNKNDRKLITSFVVYPWHRNGSLNNTKYETDGYKSAMLDKKRMSNTRFSYNTIYINKDFIWKAYMSEEEETEDNEGNKTTYHLTHTGISGATLFNSDEITLTRVPAPKNSDLQDINYYGNVDKILKPNLEGGVYAGYNIIIGGTLDSSFDSKHALFSSAYQKLSTTLTEQHHGTDPVRIKYKSTPHVVIALNYGSINNNNNTYKAQRVLPTIYDYKAGGYWSINDSNIIDTEKLFFWNKKDQNIIVSQDTININQATYTSEPTVGFNSQGPFKKSTIVKGLQCGWLWLGELYNDNVTNRFGGTTDEAIENNTWLPCGESISLINDDNSAKSSITLYYLEGDTYYQRYDHIKTYPFTLEDQNQNTDIISFMCETRVNLDGRYDRNRGQLKNFAVTPENFNKINDVYSQNNNFFNYRTVNINKLNIDSYPNIISWTKTKTLGELTDTWTNITLGATLDLDGDKGKIRAIRRFNNDLIAFQDSGISQIMYNDNMQLTTTEGVPIEVASNNKVNGKRYITDKAGCTNKWSICETPNGIYFVDDITKNIYLFNGQLGSLSDKLGFYSWVDNNTNSSTIWDPANFNNIVTYYDKGNGDVMFITKDECLNYSENIGQFTSFYSYENTPYFINFKDRGLWVKNNSLWLHNEGDYNKFFDKYQPFYTTVIANPDMQLDKIFNNIEFRSDSWDKNNNLLNTTFDKLETWNEYQKGTLQLVNKINKPSSLKKKFRIWRANIPRDDSNHKDRMRNPWLYLKLSKNIENTDKTILHDIMVYYFE